MRFPVVVLAAVAVAMPLASVPAVAQGEITQAQPQLSTEPLTIRTATRSYRFRVEVARTDLQQEAGLMFRKSVASFGGMIFPMKPVREAAFWMHNTIIPLDMVFVRTDGTIARITTARALDDAIDDSGEPVGAVLELGAGRAAALGIREGDRVEWKGLPRG
jgi:hypothetical protein